MTDVRATRRRGASALVATLLLAAATVVLASVPPRPLRSVLALVHALGLRVATDWLAVVALLSLGERVATDDGAVGRAAVRRLALAVFVGGAAIEVSPLVRHVVEPSPVATRVLVEGVASAVQEALFAAGLLLAVAAGGAALRDPLDADATGGLPLAPDEGPRVDPRALARVAQVLGAVAVAWLGVDLLTRLALGAPYFWLAVADSAVAALGGAVDYGVLAVAFLALAVGGANVRSVVGGTAAVWLVLVVLGIGVAVLSAGLGVVLVSATVTPMGAVEAAGMGLWPAPNSWAQLLATGTFLAGAAGLWTIQRSTADADASGSTAAVEESGATR